MEYALTLIAAFAKQGGQETPAQKQSMVITFNLLFQSQQVSVICSQLWKHTESLWNKCGILNDNILES